MITIRLIDARRELSLKCRELFTNERIAKEIYGYLSDGLEECEEVEPERKNGEWIEFGSVEDKYDLIRCPCCKYIFAVDSYHLTDIGFIKDDFKFCPNCGADMRGVEND